MRTHGRRFGLLGTLLFLLAVILAACAAPTVAGTTTTGSGINVFRTPNPNDVSPTPTFPPFTVGAWPSNYSPANNEHMTIYVLCKQQPTNQAGPATPVPLNTPVDIYIGAPVNRDIDDGHGHKPVTDSTGLATGQFDLNDPQSGLPVTVSVTVTLGNKSYHAETFFTPNPTQAPTPTPGPSTTPTGTVTVTPTATP